MHLVDSVYNGASCIQTGGVFHKKVEILTKEENYQNKNLENVTLEGEVLWEFILQFKALIFLHSKNVKVCKRTSYE